MIEWEWAYPEELVLKYNLDRDCVYLTKGYIGIEPRGKYFDVDKGDEPVKFGRLRNSK